jgi:hypothetical protein
MKDLSMHILDIVRNSVEAEATEISVSMTVTGDNVLTIVFQDNGRGMSAEMVQNVTDPFVTTRTTRKVGLGLPLIKMNAELTGGNLFITSELKKGTTVTVNFNLQHIDCMPFGDLGSVFSQLLGGNPDKKFFYNFATPKGDFTLNSLEVWEMMNESAVSQLKMMIFIKEMINENLEEIGLIN